MMNNQRKKIIYVVTKGNWGGAQKYVFDLATSLPKDQFDVLVVCGKGKILIQKLQKAGLKTEQIPEMKRDINVFKEIIVYLKLLKIFFDEKPDIVHVNSAKAGGIGAFLARLTLAPKIIFTVHGWAFNEPRFNNFLTKFFSWLTVFFSTDTIVISKENLKQAQKFPFVKNKFTYIPNGVKDIQFADRNSARKFIGDIVKVDVKKTWIVTISELHKNKGLEYLMEAVSKIKKKPIVFVIGSGEEKEPLENLISKLRLEKEVYLMGFIDNANSYLKAFDVFTLTSIKEGHPYVVLEAGLAGLPVIGSNISGIKDIIDDNKNGVLVKPKNSEEIKKALENLLPDNKKMAQLGHNLREKVLKEFSFKKMLDQTINLY